MNVVVVCSSGWNGWISDISNEKNLQLRVILEKLLKMLSTCLYFIILYIFSLKPNPVLIFFFTETGRDEIDNL